MIVEKNHPFPNSMQVSSLASFVIRASSPKEIEEAVEFAKSQNLPLIPIGSGTNLIPSSHIKAIVLILEVTGIVEENSLLKVGAGEEWDKVVEFAVERGLSGIEALSAIPGKAGAAPIQNIGAYGSELGQTLESVEAYDTVSDKFVQLNNEECKFGYRDSVFKQNKGRYIISSISLKISKQPAKIPDYKDVKKYFEDRVNSSPSLSEIREAIIEIRKNKLPDPNVVPNCGSFFKNPFVDRGESERLKKEFPNLPLFESNNLCKIPAGFLIEQAGFKGQKVGKAEVYKNNALVLTNPYHASFEDLLEAKNIIQQTVFQKFSVMLEPEVNIY